METWHVPRTSQTLEKPWFPAVSRWIALEAASGAVVAEKSPKARLYHLVETRGLQFEYHNKRRQLDVALPTTLADTRHHKLDARPRQPCKRLKWHRQIYRAPVKKADRLTKVLRSARNRSRNVDATAHPPCTPACFFAPPPATAPRAILCGRSITRWGNTVPCCRQTDPTCFTR